MHLYAPRFVRWRALQCCRRRNCWQCCRGSCSARRHHARQTYEAKRAAATSTHGRNVSPDVRCDCDGDKETQLAQSALRTCSRRAGAEGGAVSEDRARSATTTTAILAVAADAWTRHRCCMQATWTSERFKPSQHSGADEMSLRAMPLMVDVLAVH